MRSTDAEGENTEKLWLMGLWGSADASDKMTANINNALKQLSLCAVP
jgi:hypothetical protein